jgi:hypothetical protein
MQEFQGHRDPLFTQAVKNGGAMFGGICDTDRNSFESIKDGQGDPLFDAATRDRSPNYDLVVMNLEVHKHRRDILNEIDNRRRRKNLEHCIEEHKHHWELLNELEHLPNKKRD